VGPVVVIYSGALGPNADEQGGHYTTFAIPESGVLKVAAAAPEKGWTRISYYY